MRIDLASTPLGGVSPDLRSGRAGLGTWCGHAHRAALERRSAGLRRLVHFSFPAVMALVFILAATVWGQRSNQRAARSKAAATAAGEPNVLLIVMDTVARATRASTAMTVQQAQPSSSWPNAEFDSTVPRQPRRGRCLHTQACLRGDGRTSSPPAGSHLLMKPIPPWPVTWGTRLCDGRFHRQLLVLRIQLRAGPWFHRVPRLHFPTADSRVLAGGPGQSSAEWASVD